MVTEGFTGGRRSPTICLGACASPPCPSFWRAFRPLSPRIEASRASKAVARWGEALSHTPALNYGKIFRPLCVSTPNLPPGCHQAFSMPPVSSQTTRETCCNAQVPPLHLDSAHVDYLQSMCEKQQVTAVVCCSWLCAPQCLCMQKPLFVEAAFRHRCMRACGRQTLNCALSCSGSPSVMRSTTRVEIRVPAPPHRYRYRRVKARVARRAS